MAITREKVCIDGKVYEREIDTNEAQVHRFMVSDQIMGRLGLRLDSYAARVEQGRKGPMASAMAARNHKNGKSRKAESAARARREQAKTNREGK